jgi:hypothetical protein
MRSRFPVQRFRRFPRPAAENRWQAVKLLHVSPRRRLSSAWRASGGPAQRFPDRVPYTGVMTIGVLTEEKIAWSVEKSYM